MKFAFLVMYELRALNKTINNLYKNIVNYYDADIFILSQIQDNNNIESDIENIKKFDKNVVHKEVYIKPVPEQYFNKKYDINQTNIWNTYNGMQIYINLHKMGKLLESYKDKYDYFIILRTDIEILFPFPDKNLFENIPEGIYSFDPDYCRHWGGWATGVFVHKKYIIDYLNCCYNTIINEELINKFYSHGYKYLNQENFINFSLLSYDLKFEYIKNLNIFFTAEDINSRTTWGNIDIHPKYNVIYKYLEQCEEAYNNLELWKNNARWVYEDNKILLKIN